MAAIGTDQFLEGWKKQVEASVRMMDAVVEATAKMRSAQLAAATDTHQRALELEKALSEAKSAQEMWNAQWSWALGCCERSAEYWRGLLEAMNQANGELARCARETADMSVPAEGAGAVSVPGFAAMDGALREMLKSSQQFLQAVSGVAQPSAGKKEKKTA
jgi:hypothetical protein